MLKSAALNSVAGKMIMLPAGQRAHKFVQHLIKILFTELTKCGKSALRSQRKRR